MAKLADQSEEPAKAEESNGDNDRPQSGKLVNEQHIVQTDPDASLVRHRVGKSLPSYKNHRVLDDKAGVLTALRTTTGRVPDAHQLVGLIEEHQKTVSSKPRVAIADSAYGVAANFMR